MEELHKEGVPPTMVQVGNELTNGLLWPTGRKPAFDAIARYISSGIRGVRAVDQKVPIMIHLDNGGNNEMYREWFDEFTKREEDFQIIGLSYYPFWHETADELEFNMQDMAERYHRKIVVAEVSMGFTMESYAGHEKLAEGQRKGMATKPELVEKLEYPMTKDGQADFMKDIMRRIASVSTGSRDGFRCRGAAGQQMLPLPIPGRKGREEMSGQIRRCLILTAMRCLHWPPSGIFVRNKMFFKYIFSLARQSETSQRRLTM